MTTQIHAALNSTIPTHQARLDSLVQARRYDAQQVKDRTTPWVNFFARQQGREREKAKLLDGEDGARGRILRVDGVLGEGDGLSRIERWAEEVVSSYLIFGNTPCRGSRWSQDRRQLTVRKCISPPRS